VVSSSPFHLVEFSLSSSLIVNCVVVSQGVSDDGEVDDEGEGGKGGEVVVRSE